MSDTCKHDIKKINVCVDCLREQFGTAASSFAAPPGSAAVSADAWAIIGRAAMEKAQDAVADGKLGTADGHRKNAEMAFGFELKLRQPPNSVLGDPCKE